MRLCRRIKKNTMMVVIASTTTLAHSAISLIKHIKMSPILQIFAVMVLGRSGKFIQLETNFIIIIMVGS